MPEVVQKQQKQEPRAIIMQGKRTNANLQLLFLSWQCSVSGCGDRKPNSSLDTSTRIIKSTLTAKS